MDIEFKYHRYSGYTYFISKIAQKLGILLILEFNSSDTWKIKYWEKAKIFLKSLFKKLF